jgi:uncharacterized protein (TIGR00369 family)
LVYFDGKKQDQVMTMELTPERLEFLKKDYARGFIADLGIKALHLERGYLETQLIISARHRQQDQYIHAGVLATMADHTAGYAAFSLVDETQRILTIEFKINFLRPAFGKSLICKSRILREGGQILVGESEVYDQQPQGEGLAAKAMVTLMAVPKNKIKPVEEGL